MRALAYTIVIIVIGIIIALAFTGCDAPTYSEPPVYNHSISPVIVHHSPVIIHTTPTYYRPRRYVSYTRPIYRTSYRTTRILIFKRRR